MPAERKEAVDRISYDTRGRLDEIVGTGVAHLERLGKNDWYLSIGHADGSETALWFKSKRFPDLIERRSPLSRTGERGE